MFATRRAINGSSSSGASLVRGGEHERQHAQDFLARRQGVLGPRGMPAGLRVVADLEIAQQKKAAAISHAVH